MQKQASPPLLLHIVWSGQIGGEEVLAKPAPAIIDIDKVNNKVAINFLMMFLLRIITLSTSIV